MQFILHHEVICIYEYSYIHMCVYMCALCTYILMSEVRSPVSCRREEHLLGYNGEVS